MTTENTSCSFRKGTTFGGFLDIAHGHTLHGKQEDQLRLHALFSTAIAVPDAFFHCYGPIFLRAQKLLEKKKSDRLTKAQLRSRIDQDLLLGLIKGGVIWPSLRSDASSLTENFSKHPTKGSYLVPTWQEAYPVLEFLDTLIPTTARGPKWEEELTRRTFKGLEAIYLSDESSRSNQLRKGLARTLNLDLKHDEFWTGLLNAFLEALRAQKHQHYFARGPLEMALARVATGKEVGKGFYEDMKAIGARRWKTDRDKLAWRLFTDLTSCYHIGQGTVISEYASVTSALYGHTLSEKAMCAATGVLPRRGKWHSEVEPINVRALRGLGVKDILALRGTLLFSRYRDVVCKAAAESSGGDPHATVRAAKEEYCGSIAGKLPKRFRDVLCSLVPEIARLLVQAIGIRIDSGGDIATGERVADTCLFFLRYPCAWFESKLNEQKLHRISESCDNFHRGLMSASPQ